MIASYQSNHQKTAQENSSWIIAIENLVSKEAARSSMATEKWEGRCIYRLSTSAADQNKNTYTPQVVSIGPYHHGSPQLKPMEEHKERALIHFLKRSKIPLPDYMAALDGVKEKLWSAYSWDEDEDWSADAFLKVVMVDGCFMLEILRIFTHRIESYAPNDPIFSNHGIVYVMPDIKRDMLIIENQLPMLVLYKLLELEQPQLKGEASVEYLNKILCEFYFSNNPYLNMILGSPNTFMKDLGECLHVLDFCRRIWSYKTRETVLGKPPRRGWTFGDSVPSAIELHEAGIQIRRSFLPSLTDISLYEDTFTVILRLPPIIVDSATETMLLNLMCFERFHVGAGRDVTNYLVFLNKIIRDTKDVSLLCSCGIIKNDLGRDEEVAHLFNSISKDYTIDPDSWVSFFNLSVTLYCRRRWVQWRANVVRTYFSSPWASISVFASMFLFAFTLAQTGYTIFGYYKSPAS